MPDTAIAATSNKLELLELVEGFDALYFVRLSDNDFVIEKWEE